jgi:hypothetical protein
MIEIVQAFDRRSSALVASGISAWPPVVAINDRGPFVNGRIIDVTPAAARKPGMSGLAPVTIEPE